MPATFCMTAEGSLARVMKAPPRPKAVAPFSGISMPKPHAVEGIAATAVAAAATRPMTCFEFRIGTVDLR